MVKNEHFLIGLINALAVIFFLGGIFLDYYDFMVGLFVIIAASIFTSFLRPYLRTTKKESTPSREDQIKPSKTATMFCIKCGSELGQDDEYCPSCGTLNEN